MEPLIVVAVILIVIFSCIYSKRYTIYSRISRTEDLPDECAGMKLSGVVTGISDGDGFRFFHCPWLRSTQYTSQDEKLYIRLAGIDAPEMGNSDRRGQPFASASMEYLKSLILRKQIEIEVVGTDQYNRILAFAYIRGWFSDTNVNLEMVKMGYACVYTGRDAQYDQYFYTLKSHEETARRKQIGMWSHPNPQTPMNYKRIYR